MPATVTLGTTTLAADCQASDTTVKVVSTSGLIKGMALFVDLELMLVVGPGVGSNVRVLRGQSGTPSQYHDSGATIWIGRPDQFYLQDPKGGASATVAVSPWINVRNGDIWFAQGDNYPEGQVLRWWQKQNIAYGIGALGIRTKVPDVSSST
jgi:hypothetical protein